MVFGALVIVQQFTILTIFLSFYLYIIKKKIDYVAVILADVLIVCVSFILLHFLTERESFDVPQSMKSAVLSGITLRVATPILQNLTLMFSDDAIHVLTFIFSIIHLVFYNYPQSTPTHQERDIISGNISINSIILITVLLVSRMPQIEMVFAFVIFAAIGFSYVPRVADTIRRQYSLFHVIFIIIIWLCASCLLFNLNKTLFAIYQILFHFLLFVCPFWLIKMQSYKKSLKGPW